MFALKFAIESCALFLVSAKYACNNTSTNSITYKSSSQTLSQTGYVLVSNHYSSLSCAVANERTYVLTPDPQKTKSRKTSSAPKVQRSQNAGARPTSSEP
eukprot:5210388-Amphidinium_carterae.1